MSFLDEIKKNRSNLKATETKITFSDGSKAIECHGKIKLIAEKSHGFVVDTKPDTIPACVLNNKLYFGSQDAVDPNNVKNYGFTHILSVGVDIPNREIYSHLSCKYLPCLDLPETNLKEVCEISSKWISEALESGGRVFVHCNAGASRSTSIIIGYLISCKGIKFEEAYELVKSKRPCVQPNSGFLRQLKNF